MSQLRVTENTRVPPLSDYIRISHENIFTTCSTYFWTGPKLIAIFENEGIFPILKQNVTITMGKIGYKKEVLDTSFKFFQDEELVIGDLRMWITTHATYINPTLKTSKKRPSQDSWIGEFIKTIQWEVLDRKG